jgi:hypothetical protein
MTQFEYWIRKFDQAKILTNDSASTPVGLYQQIAETLGLESYEMRLMDLCWFNPIWDERRDSNFHFRKFPKGTLGYCNPAFSCCEVFLFRCFILFAFFGYNIVLIMPTEKYENCEFAKQYMDPVVEKVRAYPVAWRGWGNT